MLLGSKKLSHMTVYCTQVRCIVTKSYNELSLVTFNFDRN